MIKINRRDPLFAEIRWVTGVVDKKNLLHVEPNRIWAADKLSSHKFNKVQSTLPVGSFAVIKRTKTMLWLEQVSSESETKLPYFGELDQTYSILKLVNSICWIDYCRVIRSLSYSKKIFRFDVFERAHGMPGCDLIAWVSPNPGLPLIMQIDYGCEAIITAHSL